MLHEYAVEPELLNNWTDFRFFISQFGFDRGRLIARYPKRWKRLVYDSLAKCRPVEKKRIEERLRSHWFDGKLVVRKCEWDPSRSWLQNTVQENEIRPFRAILASDNPKDHPCVIRGIDVDGGLDFDTLDQNDPRRLWKAPRSVIVQRTAEAMADAVGKLLLHCSKVRFVDPHFGPKKLRHRKTFEQFLQKLATRDVGNLPSCIEMHLAHKSPISFFETECEESLGCLIPERITVRFVRWNADDLHNRFILTDRGGVAFLEGLDQYEGGRGRNEDVVVILDHDLCSQLLDAYDSTNDKFRYVDECYVTGTKVI